MRVRMRKLKAKVMKKAAIVIFGKFSRNNR